MRPAVAANSPATTGARPVPTLPVRDPASLAHAWASSRISHLTRTYYLRPACNGRYVGPEQSGGRTNVPLAVTHRSPRAELRTGLLVRVNCDSCLPRVNGRPAPREEDVISAPWGLGSTAAGPVKPLFAAQFGSVSRTCRSSEFPRPLSSTTSASGEMTIDSSERRVDAGPLCDAVGTSYVPCTCSTNLDTT